jgi:hypothetical protein
MKRAHGTHNSFLALLALAHGRRGKSNSAIVRARQACTPTAPSKEHGNLLISALLDAGLLREAASHLDGV